MDQNELNLINWKKTRKIWRDRLAKITIPSIKWINMPKTVDLIYLERSLFYNSEVIFFVADDALVVQKGYGTNRINNYNIPQERVVNAPNGFTATLNDENSIICYNNILRTASCIEANIYADRLAEIDTTIDINIAAQKTPIMLKSDQEGSLSILKAYSEYCWGSPVIAVTDSFDPNAISVLRTEAPFLAPSLKALQADIFSDYCTGQGIAASNIQKAERLIVPEVASTNAGVLLAQEAKLKPRRAVCDRLNNDPYFSRFLTDGPVSVEFEYDVIDNLFSTQSKAKKVDTEEDKGSEE